MRKCISKDGLQSSSVNGFRSNSFRLNPAASQPHYPNQRHSDLSNLSLIYLKKGLSGSSSFHNKVNLYSNNFLADPDPDSMDNLLTTVDKKTSASINTANINRFIGPKLAVNASSTSTCSLVGSGGSHKPPLPHSKSSFSEFYNILLSILS